MTAPMWCDSGPAMNPTRGPTAADTGRSCRISRPSSPARTGTLPAVDLGRIELPVGIDERQPRAAVSCLDPAVEARMAAGMARRALLLDADPDGVLIAIGA